MSHMCDIYVPCHIRSDSAQCSDTILSNNILYTPLKYIIYQLLYFQFTIDIDINSYPAETEVISLMISLKLIIEIVIKFIFIVSVL